MGGNESKSIKEEIICPKCPSTPIINIFLNQEGALTSEYRCQNMHYGSVPFDELFKNRKNSGKICDLCKQDYNIQPKKKIPIEELLYCGTCKQFICNNCRPQHDKDKESHKILVEKSKLTYTCLEHNKNYIKYCFSCLTNVCPDCKRHDKHVVKVYNELVDQYILESFDFYIQGFARYIKNFKRQKAYNEILFDKFKKRNQQLIDYAKYLYQDFEIKKKENKLNGEMIINFLNIADFNYDVNNDEIKNKQKFEEYCKSHIILKFKPISFICTFSKNKQDYNISRTNFVEYCAFDSMNKTPEYFKYSPIGETIIFSSETCIYIVSTKTENKKIEKIHLEDKIYSFNILNENILCICTIKELVFYKLEDKPPFYSKDEVFPTIESLYEDIITQIMGNFNKFIVAYTIDGKVKLFNDKKEKKKFEIVATDEGNNADYKSFEFKGIWKNFLVIKNNKNIFVKDLNKPKLDIIHNKQILEKNEQNILVFNGNVLTYEKKEVLFYSLPNLDLVSRLELLDKIISINIVNPRTMITIENEYIEQIEVNTWKRLWHRLRPNTQDFLAIGAEKKLFMYNKYDNKIYYAKKD